ncbi:hypothetical protein MASR1M12_01270 [Erysipelotrichia bacterium]
MKRVLLCWILFFGMLLIGCHSNPVAQDVAHLDEKMDTTVSFVVAGANRRPSILASGNAAEVTFRLRVINPDNPSSPVTVMVKKSGVENGVASVVFSGVPARNVVGEIEILNGSIGGARSFCGASRLMESTQNVITVFPSDSAAKEVKIAEALLYLASDPQKITLITDTVIGSLSTLLDSVTSSGDILFAELEQGLRNPPAVNILPVAEWTLPVSDIVATAGEILTFSGLATDTDGIIQKIEFYANNQLWSTFDGNSFGFRVVADGPSESTVFFKAYDDKGGVVASRQIAIKVYAAEDKLPACSWLAPLSHIFDYAGATLTFAGEAVDSDGQIVKIEVYVNGKLFDTINSYAFAYQFPQNEPMEASIFFRAYDDKGGFSDSEKIGVFIVDPPVVVKPLALYLYSDDGKNLFLGNLTTAANDTNGVFNRYGDYGSEYKNSSIWYSYGAYGSSTGQYSAFNLYSHHPPKIINQDGKVVGYLSKNKFLTTTLPIIDPANLKATLQELNL